jgi:hypothetical protein
MKFSAMVAAMQINRGAKDGDLNEDGGDDGGNNKEKSTNPQNPEANR